MFRFAICETQGTGLRNRFFLITFAVLLVVSIATVGIYALLLKKERMILIDQQVRETAAALVDSELGDLRKINFKAAEKIISEELGESRFGKFFVIRDSKGERIYESSSSNLLPIANIPNEPQWFSFSYKGQFIRGLNLKLPRFPDRTLQVGVVLDEKLLGHDYFSEVSLLFIAVVFVLGLLTSFFLTSFLVKPISNLEHFLSDVTQATQKQSVLPQIPSELFPNRSSASNDEFERLLAGLEALIQRVNRNYQFSRIWAYQMAHELKTPLSFLTIEIESLKKDDSMKKQLVDGLQEEVKNISETINSFLNWAELENSEQQRHLYRNRLGTLIQKLTQSWPEVKSRIQLKVETDPIVIANPQHLEQLLANLLGNALHYSPADTLVKIELDKNSLVVEDAGGGIPSEVLARIGEPFNRGAATRNLKQGHGLGLAWVKSVCRLYGWTIRFDAQTNGTRVEVRFPVQEELLAESTVN